MRLIRYNCRTSLVFKTESINFNNAANLLRSHNVGAVAIDWLAGVVAAFAGVP